MPPFQREILAGTAPAPFVYRQAIPMLRALVMRAAQPGHAAVAVDIVLAAIAVAAMSTCALIYMGLEYGWLLGVLTTLACVSCYPNDKPEAVGAVAVTALVAASLLTGRSMVAAGISLLAAGIRPEFPILVGLAMASVPLPTVPEPKRRRDRWLFLLVGASGMGFLALARFVIWPAASYPAGTAVFMLGHNLATPAALPGTALCIMLCLVNGVAYAALCRPAQRDRSACVDAAVVPALLGLAVFTILWICSILIVGKAEEFRLLQPVIPLTAVTALITAHDRRTPDVGA
jgi:hypothetical protein